VTFTDILDITVLDFDTTQNQAASQPTPTGIAILTVCAGILVALIGGWVEVRKSRLSQQKVEHEVTPHRETENTSLREQLQRVADNVSKLDDKLDQHTERLVRVETKVDGGYSRRSTDR
jgi:uncharacterized protein YlxW (UPF0749 family)